MNVLTEEDSGCDLLPRAGIDAGKLKGSELGYGYNEEYYGHAQVLMVYSGSWSAATFASMSGTTFSYDWELAYITY